MKKYKCTASHKSFVKPTHIAKDWSLSLPNKNTDSPSHVTKEATRQPYKNCSTKNKEYQDKEKYLKTKLNELLAYVSKLEDELTIKNEIIDGLRKERNCNLKKNITATEQSMSSSN